VTDQNLTYRAHVNNKAIRVVNGRPAHRHNIGSHLSPTAYPHQSLDGAKVIRYSMSEARCMTTFLSKPNITRERKAIFSFRVARLAISWPISKNLAIFDCAGHEKKAFGHFAKFGHFFGLSL